MKILLIGDSCIDRFNYGKVHRLDPAAPVPILETIEFTENEGMASNVKSNLENLNVSVDFITNKKKPIKTRWIDKESNQMLLRTDVNDSVEEFVYEDSLFMDIEKFDAVVISDYNKGFVSTEDIDRISKKHPLIFLDTKKKIQVNSFKDVNFLKINKTEWMNNRDQLNSFPGELIVTLGPEGAMWNNKPFKIRRPSKLFDLTGAGDVFLATLVFKYIETKSIPDSIKFANICASKSVQKRGTSIINLEDIK
jgi:bifunctional ADP-heptose synthase (sugar kinase/adenylyltransferase)